jgi:hypothetical protein
MSLEAKCDCSWSGGSGEVRALLEARELILRGHLRCSFLIAEIRHVRVEGERLQFKVAGDEIALGLSADRAGRWAKKITTPPPALAQKLGVGPSSKVLVMGPMEDAALRQALEGSRAASAEEARLCLAVVTDVTALEQALRVMKPCRSRHRSGSSTSRGHVPRSAKLRFAS